MSNLAEISAYLNYFNEKNRCGNSNCPNELNYHNQVSAPLLPENPGGTPPMWVTFYLCNACYERSYAAIERAKKALAED
jgi:hypothetical protein